MSTIGGVRLLDQTYRRVYEGVNYRLRSLAGGRLAAHCRPTSIVFLLTELCNARCIHCDIWKNKGKEDGPTPEQWKQVLSDLRTWLGPVMTVFSGGEALLKPYTIDLVAHSRAIGLYQEILTHGYWKDQSKIEQLALAHPSRVTVSLDGLGEVHSRVRGKDDFFEKTNATISTFQRMRKEKGLNYVIRVKTVIMSHNLDNVVDIARFANQDGMHVFYQPIEQNYNTAEDTRWFETSENWPKDTARAIAVVRELIRMKREGFHIDNSLAQLEAMIPYFQDPDSLRVATQSHMAQEKHTVCAALTTLQLHANGDVRVCTGHEPVGNVRQKPIRRIWEERPALWESGCCLERRCTDAEKKRALVSIS
jgi:MoaA/NifB/PqqE/SkfB family radical SAM enzyme